MMQRLCMPLVVILFLGLLPVQSAQSATPDFSGTWQLNGDKGKNLGMVKAVKETVVARQTATQLVLQVTDKFMMQTFKRTVTYDLNGKSLPNEGPMGEKGQTVARWQGNALVVTWSSPGAVAGTQTVKTETRVLSADGKTMTVTTSRKNKDPMEMVFDRQ